MKHICTNLSKMTQKKDAVLTFSLPNLNTLYSNNSRLVNVNWDMTHFCKICNFHKECFLTQRSLGTQLNMFAANVAHK